MTTTEHPVRQLLWCALNALKTAQENHNITSETGLRHYLLEWLSGASRHPEFRSLPGEIMALKAYMSAHGLRGCSMNPLNGPVPGNVICYN